MAERGFLGTMTGEKYQPVRLHYRVFDRKALLGVFKKLRCVDRDPTRLRWVWLYDFEARNLSLPKSVAEIPRQYYPIIIGSFIPRSEDEMVLDLRSCERAVLAIPFFDRHIPRSAARVIDAEVANRLFSVEEAQLSPDQFFDRQQTPPCDPEAVVRKITELVANVRDPQEKLRIVSEYMRSEAKHTLAESERIPIHFYEDGLGGFELALKLRQIIALQHWLGNTTYSMYDAIQEVVPKAQ